MNNVFTFEQVFAGRILEVPGYQRGYSWDEAQWRDMLEDIELLPPKRIHYTGTVVLDPAKDALDVLDTDGVKHAHYHVVDGQQRLTTVVVLLQALRQQMVRSGKQALHDGIGKAFMAVTSEVTGQPIPKLRLNRDCHEFFSQVVLADHPAPNGPTIASHERLVGAKKYFDTFLEQRRASMGAGFDAWLVDFYDKLVHSLKVNMYEVTDASEVGVIFEVLNNRGKPLSELEKVKNFLLYMANRLGDIGKDLTDQVYTTWEHVLERLMLSHLTSGDDEDSFLRACWLMAYSPAPKDWQGTRSFKGRFKLKDYLGRDKELLADLLGCTKMLDGAAVAYCDIHHPWGDHAFSALGDAALRRSLQVAGEKLRRIGVVAPFTPLLMAARLKFPSSGEQFLVLLKLCEIYAFRVYKAMEKRSDAGNNQLFRLGNDVYRGQRTFEQAIDQLKATIQWYSPDATFNRYFDPVDLASDNDWFDWTALKYLLYEYEEYLARGKDLGLTWDAVEKRGQKSIEHILPQNPDNPYWLDRFSPEQRALYTHDIGNLCLSYLPDNSAYRRKPFPDKVGSLGSTGPCYLKSTLIQERNLAAYSEWTVEEILKRRAAIAGWAIKRWHVDPPVVPATPSPDEADDEETV